MRWSQTHIPTLRADPADAEAASHRLLVRAGFIRQLMAGHYTLLPLAVRVRAKIIEVIREEMNRIGAQEFILPAMHPAEIWQRTGRWEGMGEEMFRVRDRKGADIALAMTHEELFTTLALVVLDPTDPETGKACQTICEQLTAAGVDVIVDDRDDRPGVKFRDVELVGIPYRMTIGARDLANGTVELAHRVSGNKEALPVGAAADRILALVTAATT